jgi:hypothetical protein
VTYVAGRYRKRLGTNLDINSEGGTGDCRYCHCQSKRGRGCQGRRRGRRCQRMRCRYVRHHQIDIPSNTISNKLGLGVDEKRSTVDHGIYMPKVQRKKRSRTRARGMNEMIRSTTPKHTDDISQKNHLEMLNILCGYRRPEDLIPSLPCPRYVSQSCLLNWLHILRIWIFASRYIQ